MTTPKRARIIELTRYSKAWRDEWLLQNDGVIQRAGSQGGVDYRYSEFHPHVMKFDVRGAYWYFGSATPWKVQADAFLKIVGKDFHFLACDFEEYGNSLSKSFVASAMEFMVYLRDKGHRVILYTNQSTYQDWIYRYDAARAAKFPFWFSWPADNSPAVLANVDTYLPPAPKSRPQWDIWQYSFGEHNSIGCELDVFRGTVAEFRAWAGADDVIDPPPPPVEPTDHERILALESALRIIEQRLGIA